MFVKYFDGESDAATLPYCSRTHPRATIVGGMASDILYRCKCTFAEISIIEMNLAILNLFRTDFGTRTYLNEYETQSQQSDGSLASCSDFLYPFYSLQ